jgi:parvulin-like peptidyl-prolyl isomerase
LARKAAQETLLNDVTFHDDELPAVVERLWEGIKAPPPQTFSGDWLLSVPDAQVGVVSERWDELRRQKLLDQTYGQLLESYFLERRADLETIVYGMIRTRNQGVAEEVYLKIVDDGASFSEMAKIYSLGDERYTHGLVGPMAISQPHPSIREVLSTLKVGETAPPLRIDTWVLILKMEHRQPAQLSEPVRQQLLLELFESDLRKLLPDLMESRALPEDIR